MGIFNVDNKFFRALNKLVDMVILRFCWVISCIPVFTIGAASTALYDTSRRVIHHDEGYVWRGYWHAFKVNFKQATKAWLVQHHGYSRRGEEYHLQVKKCPGGISQVEYLDRQEKGTAHT